MRLLFLGDVVGRSGRQAVVAKLPELRARYKLDFVAVNGENAAGGFGITESIVNDLIDAGADVVTLGNHAFDQKEALVFIERQQKLLRPINYPPGTPGRGSGLFKAANGADVLVINAQGLVFMPELADPFRAVDAEVAACGLKRGADAILVDFHAEATSEKQALAYFLDGRVSLVVGTHTHAPTADERVLPEGTAFIGDLGMCGDYDSVLGMVKDEPLNRFLTKIPRSRMEPALGPASIAGVAVETDDTTGLATRVAGVRLGGVLAPNEPRFWVD
jgi:2',3'-cyclic-nucleotide 2'-phosphodiesterase